MWWFWVPNISHPKTMWSGGDVEFSILKIRLWDVLSRIQKYLENESQRHSGTNFSHAQWCFLLSEHLSVCDYTLLRTVFSDIRATPVCVDNSWWAKRLFKPTSRNFPNPLLTPIIRVSEIIQVWNSYIKMHLTKVCWSVWMLLPRDRISSNIGQGRRTEPHFLAARLCFLSENDGFGALFRDLTVRESKKSKESKKPWCGFFLQL